MFIPQVIKLVDIPYKSLNPKSKLALYIVFSIIYGILLLILFLPILFLNDQIGKWYDLYLILSVAVAVVALVYIIVAPQIFYRHYKYALTNDSIDVLRGIIIIRRTMVPVERIHQVEVIRGPVNNLLGLADVYVTTAGGIAKIQFLEIPVANKIADELNDYINKIVRGLKEDD